MEEDACFICFDRGDLVLCGRMGYPKAYHTACVGRDEAFCQAKGKWNCGWHLCSNYKKKQRRCLFMMLSRDQWKSKVHQDDEKEEIEIEKSSEETDESEEKQG